MSNINVLTEIVKNMKVPEGILSHVLEPGQDYNYDVCEFLAETIEVSDKERFCVLKSRRTTMGDAIFLKIGAYEYISMAKLGHSGRFNDQRDAEIAKKYSSSVVSFCREQSKLISEREDDIVFGNAYEVYLNMPKNENKSIKEEYDNSLDISRYHVNQIKDICDNLAKKHEFILNNFSYLRDILVKYFEKKQSTENLIDSAYAYDPLFDLSMSEDFILDKLNLIREELGKDGNTDYRELKKLIISIQKDSEYMELNSDKLNKAIKKMLVTKLAGQLNRLESLL
ncbi:hypothetical protein COY26_00195 [Candidatus Woesearchaeota archaeon CG_4_10_14_0_2_um_filter_33_10]|nr:MAG: hypothetical protein COY26_00195 [Candidatus Woesearchaeota archaeon CG_4_10_14_0_2_um_filter_33_10]